MKDLIAFLMAMVPLNNYSVKCKILPHHRISLNNQIEDSSIAPVAVRSSGKCVDLAESKIGAIIKNKITATSVDFIIEKPGSTIKGTIITPRMDIIHTLTNTNKKCVFCSDKTLHKN